MTTTPEQDYAINEILKFKNQLTSLGGLAGSGKSFCVNILSQKLPNFAVACYTGKAAHNLRKRGIKEASTIHSAIYKPELDSFGNIVLNKDGSPKFILNPNLPYEGFIIDEASMVSKEIYTDLLSFNVPIVFVGDHGQLEPIGDSINLMEKPDYVLEEIHRNAGEIAFFANHIRQGYRAGSFPSPKKIRFVNKYTAEEHFTKVDQIICAYNKTRVYVNKTVREQLGLNPSFPVEGDRVLCLKNNKNKGLFNGMQGVVERMFSKPKNKMTFSADDMAYDVLFDPKQFNREKYEIGMNRDDPEPFDYAYAVTCHRYQGSETENTMVLEQRCSLWDHRRWAYTAASRAKNSVIWVENF